MNNNGIPVKNLMPGMVLSESIYTEDGKQDTSFSFPKSLEERLFISYNGQRVLKLADPSIQKAKKHAIESSHRLLKVFTRPTGLIMRRCMILPVR